MDRLQRIREDIVGLEQALEESGTELEENELGALDEDDEREEFVLNESIALSGTRLLVCLGAQVLACSTITVTPVEQ